MKALNKKTFDQIKDKDFKLKLNDESYETFSLIEVKSIASGSNSQNEAFSLLFQTNNEAVYEQATYQFLNLDLGEVNLFVVPIASNDSGVQYEAIFT